MKKYLITGATLMMCAALGFVTLTSFDEPQEDAAAAQEAAIKLMAFEMEAPLLEELAQACQDRALETAQQQLIEEGMKAPATSRSSKPSKPKPSTTTTTTTTTTTPTTTTTAPPPPPPAPEKPTTTGSKWDTKDPANTSGTTTDSKWDTKTPTNTQSGSGTTTGDKTTKSKWGPK